MGLAQELARARASTRGRGKGKVRYVEFRTTPFERTIDSAIAGQYSLRNTPQAPPGLTGDFPEMPLRQFPLKLHSLAVETSFHKPQHPDFFSPVQSPLPSPLKTPSSFDSGIVTFKSPFLTRIDGR